jgi:5-formyltetrahydrofolate cyclo-ligase
MIDKVNMSTSVVAKKVLRSTIKKKLQNINSDSIDQQSLCITALLQQLPQFIESHNISIFLSMKNEVQTEQLIKVSLQQEKTVFIPKVFGKNAQDMTMVPVSSWESIELFERNEWGIPEPPIEFARNISDATLTQIDLVIVPGVGFCIEGDQGGARIGYGRGYYG